MSNCRSSARRQSRFPVRWPIRYGGEEFLADGTVLDLTRHGWRVAGTMPVEAGMRLTLQVWPPGKPDGLRIEQATVWWVKGCEFALDINVVAPHDQEWMVQFLDHSHSWWLWPRAAERRSSLTGAARQNGRVPSSRRTGWETPRWPCAKDFNGEHGG